MLIEQIRYYIEEENLQQVLDVRREETRLRDSLGLPPGQILVADPVPADAPGLIWQCAYEDESSMASATAGLIGNAEYEAIRERLRGLTNQIELELYMVDED